MRRLSRRWAAWLPGLLLWSAGVGAAEVELQLEGVEDRVRDNVRQMLTIAAEAVDADTPERLIRRHHRQAPEEIQRALEPFGYYEATIDARLTREDERWRATYRIDPGPRVRLTEVMIRLRGEAADDRAFASLREELPLRADQPLVHADYDNAKRELMALADRRGYFDAAWVTSTLRIEPAARSARAELVLDSGRRYRFGEVSFDEAGLDDAFLRRYLPFEPGDPWRSDRLLDLQFALDDSDYFRTVDVHAQRDRARDGRVPVRVRLEPRPNNRYTFGVGFGTDTGARVSAGWERRRVNDSGHSFDAEIELAQVRTRVSARYRIPLADPARERLVLESGLGTEDIGDGETRQFDLGVRRVEQFGRYQGTVSLEFQRSEDKIGGERTRRDLVIPGASLLYSRFDDTVYARSGLRLGASVSGGAETLGSDVSFLRGRVDGRSVFGLWEGGRLLLRGEVGSVEVNDLDELPLSQRFFAGGDDSVRGFDFQALGPRNDDGDVIGGRHLLVGSVELEQMLVGNWGAAVFVDSGNAMNDWDEPLRTAAGVGLRYRSPVGVFRVDVAKATDGDESPRLHLSLGVDL